MSESDYADYNGLVELARRTATEAAERLIPKLCEQLHKENPELSKEDVRETVTNDCKDFWLRATIIKFMPDEYKDPQKQEAGRKRQEKRLEEPIPARPVPAENSSVSSTEQESESFDRPRKDVYTGTEHIAKIQREFKSRLEQKEGVIENMKAEIEQKAKEINKLRGLQDIKDVPVVLEDLLRQINLEQ